MREITTHVVNPVNDKLKIKVLDEPGPGGANHHYIVTGFSDELHLSHPYSADRDGPGFAALHFQKGPIAEAAVNGLTHEVLLAILIDRLEAFQRGPFPHYLNENALGCLKEALEFLQQRTRERMERGVEGRSVI